MVDLIFGAVLGALSLGFITLLVRSRSLNRQVDALRAEVAVARIEGVLAAGSDGARPDVVRRKGHLGLVRSTGALAGLTVGALSWIRSHRIASSGAVAAAAAVTVGAVYLGGPESRRSEAPPRPMPGAVLSPTLSPREPAPSSTPSAGPRPRSARASADPSPSAAVSTAVDPTDLVSLLPVAAPVPVPSVPPAPSGVSLAPTPSPSLPCVRVRLGSTEARACLTR